MFTCEFRESTQDLIELHGVSGVGLKAMVSFAYSGGLLLDLDNVSDVLGAASHFQSEEAISLCARYLKRCMSTDNCIDIFRLGELYSLNKVKDFATAFILEEFEKFAMSEQYFKLTDTELAQLLQSNCLKISSEYCLFELVLRWIMYDSENRKQYAVPLLSNVRFSLMSVHELIKQVGSFALINESKECLQLVMSAKDYHLQPVMQPLLQSASTQVRSDQPCLVRVEEQRVTAYSLTNEKTSILQDCPVKQYNPCVIVVNNFLYTCGGKLGNYSSLASSTFQRYDPRFDNWMLLPPMSKPRKNFCLTYKNGYIYAIGGHDGDGHTMRSMDAFNVSTNAWEKKCRMPERRQNHTAATCIEQDRVFVTGGKGANDSVSYKVFAYSPETDIWQELASMPVCLENHGMYVTADKIFVFGGKRSLHAHTLFICDLATGDWTQHVESWQHPGPVRGLTFHDSTMYFIGSVESTDMEMRGVEQIIVVKFPDIDKNASQKKTFQTKRTVTIDLLNSASFCTVMLPTSVFK
jgi:hypothetical protein